MFVPRKSASFAAPVLPATLLSTWSDCRVSYGVAELSGFVERAVASAVDKDVNCRVRRKEMPPRQRKANSGGLWSGFPPPIKLAGPLKFVVTPDALLR